MAEPEETTDASAKTTAYRLSLDGYGLEVQGYTHIDSNPGEAMVFLERDTAYKIRISNSNSHVCMVKVELDNFVIGTFLLHPYTKCDIERPTDRPLGFAFLQTQTQAQEAQNRKKNKKKDAQEHFSRIIGVFKPESGGKIIQVDVSAEHLNRTERLELLNDTSISDLFEDIRKDFGDWIMSPTCLLLHWTNAEYDSPVEDVLTLNAQVELRSFRRQEDPLRKMSLLSFDHVEVQVEGHDIITYPEDTVPTFSKVMQVARVALNVDSEVPLYFLSTCGRYLASTNWIKGSTQICHVMHRDEMLIKPGTLVVRVTTNCPPQINHVIMRMLNDGTNELEVVSETTVRECRAQLECLGGPWGDDPRWLFGGTLLENGRNIGFYGIGDRSTVDVVPRLQDTRSFNSLEMRDPIAVDGDQPVNTSEMIRREESRYDAMMEKKKRKPHRGGTTLRGRIRQQYIEVDPVETDERFLTKMSISVMPKDKEEEILRKSKEPEKIKGGKTCAIS